jgi:hypothetical protein
VVAAKREANDAMVRRIIPAIARERVGREGGIV